MILDSIKALMGFNKVKTNLDNTDNVMPEADEQGGELDRDRDGMPLYEENIVAFIDEELDKRKRERQPLELQWQLNSNFYCGNQYCDVNVSSGEIQQYEPPYPWMQHESFNQIAPLMETRMANLQKVGYAMTVKPRTNEYDDIAKAKVSTSILRYLEQAQDFSSRKNSALLWAEVTGTAVIMSWWDDNAGDDLGDGVHDGDLRYGLLTPYEVYPESVFKQDIDDQRSVIIDQVRTVDEIFDIYGVHTAGTSVDVCAMSPVPSAGGFGYESTVLALTHRQIEDSEHVITYFERPSRLYKDGRMAVKIADKLVYYGALPYGMIPLVVIRSKIVPGQFFGKSPIQDLIPLQRAYNGVKNTLHDYIKCLALGGYSVEEGSVDMDELTDNGLEPGKIWVRKRGTEPPVPRQNADIPDVVYNEIQQIRNDMEYLSGVSQLMMTGGTPRGVTAGTAIQNLRDIDSTRMSLSGDLIRDAIRDLAVQWLKIYKLFARWYRALNITGNNDVGDAVVWCADDINSYDVEYDAENELRVSEETQRDIFLNAYNMGLFTDESGQIPQKFKQRAVELMKIGQYSDILSENTLQTQNAKRENTFFSQGVIPEINELDNHQIHLDEHTRYALQMDFRVKSKSDPQYAELFMAHVRQHQAVIAQQEAQQQMEAMANQTQNLNGGNNKNG